MTVEVRRRLTALGAVLLAVVAASTARADKIAFQGQFDASGRRIMVQSEVGRNAVVLPLPPGAQGDMITPALSRDGTAIAFAARTKDGTYQLFVWQLGKDNKPQGNAQPVTTGPGNNEQPTWSPDGSKLAYAHAAGKEYGLFVISVVGGPPTKIADLSVNFRNACPDWSPDGARVVYNVDTALWLAPTDGSGASKLREDGYYPSWSPDGKAIAFFLRKPAPALAVLDLGTSQTRTLVTGMEGYGETTWSPWGDRIAFKAARAGGKAGSHWLVQADGTRLRPLASKGTAHAYFSWSAQPAEVAVPTVVRPQGPIAIVSPPEESKVRGFVDVTAAKQDAGGYVLFQVDELFQWATASPYKFRWDTRNVPDGPHRVTAVAFDDGSNEQGAVTVAVQVRNAIDTASLPSDGVSLACRYIPQESWSYRIIARGKLGEPGEVLLPENRGLVGELRAVVSYVVDQAQSGGTGAILSARAPSATLSRGGGNERVPEASRPERLLANSVGALAPEGVRPGAARFGGFAVFTTLPAFKVRVGDTWRGDLGLLAELGYRQPVSVSASHTVVGLQWEGEQEAVKIKSSYALPALAIPQSGLVLQNVTGERTSWFAYKTHKLIRVEDIITGEVKQELPPLTAPAAGAAPALGAPAPPAVSAIGGVFGRGRRDEAEAPAAAAPPPPATAAAPAAPQPPTPIVKYTFTLTMERAS